MAYDQLGLGCRHCRDLRHVPASVVTRMHMRSALAVMRTEWAARDPASLQYLPQRRAWATTFRRLQDSAAASAWLMSDGLGARMRLSSGPRVPCGCRQPSPVLHDPVHRIPYPVESAAILRARSVGRRLLAGRAISPCPVALAPLLPTVMNPSSNAPTLSAKHPRGREAPGQPKRDCPSPRPSMKKQS